MTTKKTNKTPTESKTLVKKPASAAKAAPVAKRPSGPKERVESLKTALMALAEDLAVEQPGSFGYDKNVLANYPNSKGGLRNQYANRGKLKCGATNKETLESWAGQVSVILVDELRRVTGTRFYK